MRMNKSNGLAVILIVFGGLILLNKLFVFGHFAGFHIMSWIFPLALIALGYMGVKNGKSFIGWALMILGGIFLLGKLSGLIWILIAIGLVVYGVSMLKRNNA